MKEFRDQSHMKKKRTSMPSREFTRLGLGVQTFATNDQTFATFTGRESEGARPLRWSGRPDSNWGPHGPKPCALTRLRYAPKYISILLPPSGPVKPGLS